jgi:predicted acetyltransferase
VPEAQVPTPEQFEAYHALVVDGLRLEPDGGLRAFLAALGPERCRVVVREGRVAAGLAVAPMAQHLGGALVRSAGLSCVVVGPEWRGSGLASRMLAEAVNELRAGGVPLSCLHPANLPLYRRAGYEVAATSRRCTVSLDALVVERPGPTVRVRELPEPAPGELEALHAAWVARVPGAVERGAALWTALLRWSSSPVRVAVAERSGRPSGYAVFTRAHDDGMLRVRDLVALDGDSARGLLQHLAGHRSIHEAVQWPSLPFDPFAHLLRDRRASVSVEPVMLRLVDVAGALAARGWPRTVTGRLDLEVVDRVVAPNHGRLRLELDGGAATVREGGEGRIRLHVRALAALYTGHADVHGLRVAGELRASGAELGLLEAAFAAPQPVVNEAF